MITLITFFVLAVTISFVCSISEAGLLSLRRTDVIYLKESGSWGGGILERHKANVEQSLAGILTVNTLANCFGAAGVGSAATAIWGTSGMATASAILTVSILIFSEIIPKTLGANYSVQLANPIALAVQVMLIITYPIVLAMGLISKFIGGGSQQYTREDFLLAAKLGVTDGIMVEREAEVISRFLNRIETKVSTAFTPADEVATFSDNQTVEEVSSDLSLISHSRFPLYGERPDVIVGIVCQDEIMKKAQEGKRGCRLAELAMPVMTVHENETLEKVATRMQDQMCKMALVIDDQGRFLGVLTTGDLLRHLFGSKLAELA
ncbi:MAG: CNNM domain-containing protein [Gimesia chilikensis]|uniref:CNNM domain-containing protein n=1 Tax=Gimesia chilikensis TaxID=2605989 RepID=UPI0037977351